MLLFFQKLPKNLLTYTYVYSIISVQGKSNSAQKGLEMKQAIGYTETIGGVLKQEYIYQFERNHGHFFKTGYSGGTIYDGDEQRGYKVIDEYFENSKSNAESVGLTYKLEINR